MLEIIITLIVAIFAGVVIGLLPGMPIWLGVFLVVPFIDSFSSLQIILYWLGLAIGSQFFGSVSTLLLRVPGENSSLVYLKDTYDLTLQERLNLVRQTAWGSAFATLTSVIIVALLYYLGSGESIIQWTSSSVKFLVYSFLIFLLIFYSEKKIWAFFLLLVGIIFSDKTNSALPIWIQQMNYEISHITIFSATLALIIIPEMLAYRKSNLVSEGSKLNYDPEKIKWRSIIPGSIIGCVSGLIPGMTATIGSVSAYNLNRGSIKDKIISAESANNSAIITALLPLILIGIPTTIDSIMVSNILNMKLLELPSVFSKEVFYGITLGWMTIFGSGFFALCFFYLSQRFLMFYIKFVEITHSKLIPIYVLILSFLVYSDAISNPINIVSYSLMILGLSLVGIYLKRSEINPLPFLLGLLLGDSIIWSIYHVSTIYF